MEGETEWEHEKASWISIQKDILRYFNDVFPILFKQFKCPFSSRFSVSNFFANLKL